MSETDIIIETIQLEQRFGSVRALAPLDLTIKTGTALALVGRNGSGKSTLLRLILGFMRPTAGTVRVFGHEAARMPERLKAGIGYVAAGQDLPGGMTVASYLQYLRPFYPGWDPSFERRLTELFRVPLNHKLRHLSRGQRAKVAIIGALSFHPRLLLLDEPFSGLDPAVRDEVEEALVEVMNAGEWTMVISSHEIDEVERLADEVLVLDGGIVRLREGQCELLTRCRLISLHGAKAPAGQIPESWWNFQTGDGGRAAFLDSRHDPEHLAATVARLFPEAEPPTVGPAPLREIVRTLLHDNP